MKKSLILFLLFSSLQAFPDCHKAYIDQLKSGALNATASYFTIIGIPVGVYNSYIAHQSRKMKELIEESKNKRIGKRTKGLHKSLNGIYSTKEIHRKVIKANKIGGLCKRVWNPKSRTAEMAVTTYRDYKNQLRLEIDINLTKQRKPPIWNDPDDIRW